MLYFNRNGVIPIDNKTNINWLISIQSKFHLNSYKIKIKRIYGNYNYWQMITKKYKKYLKGYQKCYS